MNTLTRNTFLACNLGSAGTALIFLAFSPSDNITEGVAVSSIMAAVITITFVGMMLSMGSDSEAGKATRKEAAELLPYGAGALFVGMIAMLLVG